MLPAECLFHFLNKKCKCGAPVLPHPPSTLHPPPPEPAAIRRFKELNFIMTTDLFCVHDRNEIVGIFLSFLIFKVKADLNWVN